jgi:Predicted membrane protein
MIFCPQCGMSNVDNAVVCAQCGKVLQPGAVAQASPAGAVVPPAGTIPNYLVFAILSTVFCCLPAGIPGIVYAAQVNSKLQVGDFAGAQASSNNAKMWCWISFGLGLATYGFFTVLTMIGVLGNLHRR